MRNDADPVALDSVLAHAVDRRNQWYENQYLLGRVCYLSTHKNTNSLLTCTFFYIYVDA